jgi:hypothetical protein
MKRLVLLTVILLFSNIFIAFPQAESSTKSPDELPALYFRLLDAGVLRIEERLKSEPQAGLRLLEAKPGWRHFASAVLIPAVLYTRLHPSNNHYGDIRMLRLAENIGDMLAEENARGLFTPRGDSDWDTYMWLEAYRLLDSSLGDKRRKIWSQAILENISLLEPQLLKCMNYPEYNAPFIITSPNHYAIYASTLLVAGNVFDRPEWKRLATFVLRRFVKEEQAPDGYWGEHSKRGPTTGYDYLTETQIALYWEYTKDPDALDALRRSKDFHMYYTWPDGTPVETINDRNRYWDVSMWGHFGFSNFPDGRRYAAFLTSFFSDDGDIQSLSRLAQNLLYFHEGKMEPIPQDMFSYYHQMQVPAGIRKTGPWVVCLSGLTEPEDILNNFFLDRQGNISIYNKKSGLIITGANSKRQPDLATFTETINNHIVHMPLNCRLQMNDSTDRLAMAYNTFFAILRVPKPSEKRLEFRFITRYKWGEAEVKLNLQVVLKPGLSFETGSGIRIVPGKDPIDLSGRELGGCVIHNGWVLHIPEGARLTWPVFPFNPYADGPETSLDHAIGILSIPLKEEDQELSFSIDVN